MSLKYSLIAALCCWLGFLFSLAQAAGQADALAAPNGAPRQSAKTVLFQQQPARVGDRVAQHVTAALDLKTTILQSDQLANQSEATLGRQQKRFIEVTEVVDGRVRSAQVTFPLARLTAPKNNETGNNEPANIEAGQETILPVEGNSYTVTRQGEQLIVADSSGSIPPLREFAIVLQSLQTLGLPSPLAKFLLGRTVQVGERLQLPRQIAEEMMGFDDHLGQVNQFVMELKELRQVDNQPCAVFGAMIEAKGDPENPVLMKVQGEVIIRTDSCRTVSAELSGPLSMSANEKTDQGSFRVTAEGSMRVAIRSQYGYAAK